MIKILFVCHGSTPIIMSESLMFLAFLEFPKQVYYWFTTSEKLDYLLRHDNKKWLQFTYLKMILFLLYIMKPREVGVDYERKEKSFICG